MGQFEILDILISNPGRTFSAKELGERLGINANTVAVNIRRITHAKVTKTYTYQKGYCVTYEE